MFVNADIRAELAKLLPYGLLAARSWLMDKGLSRHGLDNLLKSGQLVSLAPGVYKRPETTLKWQGLVSSLQRMGNDLLVGGISALELQGHSHYLSLSSLRTVHLYGYDPLPSWANKVDLAETFKWHGNARLWTAVNNKELKPDFSIDLSWGDQSAPLKASSSERAICELLVDVPEKVSFEHAEQLMQGLVSLSPRRLDAILHQLKHVKAKRLFFWLAQRQGHAWFKKLDPASFDLGHGKRVVAKGGKLDRKYLITVPENMHE
ncbi:MAG: type IV toxin-antitoxin system AbiEi family antitoxin [Myxococcales bacterium]|nr:MAG: type IV toxin-antitoxin system AbiEi family antitoxin [Myxococcales bacterium]